MKNRESSIFGSNSDDIRTGENEYPEKAGQRESCGRKVSKGVYIIAVAAVSVLLAVLLIWTTIDRVNEGLIMEIQIGDVLPYTLEDGQYSGSYVSNGMGAAVTVTVESGYITGISLNGFSGIDTARVQRVFDAVIHAQSLITYDDEVGTEPTDVILLLAIQSAVEEG